MVTKGKVMVLPLIVALPPRMSLMLLGLVGEASAGNALGGKLFNSSSSQMMRVVAAYAS